MDNISFKAKIIPTYPREFAMKTIQHGIENFVGHPWTLAESVVSKNAFTKQIMDCTAIGIKNKEKTAIIVFDKLLAKRLAQNTSNTTLFLDENTEILESEIIITTPFMAKGLEFDKVIIVQDKTFDSASPLGKGSERKAFGTGYPCREP